MFLGEGEFLDTEPAPKLPDPPARRWKPLSVTMDGPVCECAGEMDWFVLLTAFEDDGGGPEIEDISLRQRRLPGDGPVKIRPLLGGKMHRTRSLTRVDQI